MPGISRIGDAGHSDCAVCGVYGSKQCSGCKAVKYCSAKCQSQHWNSSHKFVCKSAPHGKKASDLGGSSSTSIPLVPDGVFSKMLKQTKKVQFPYDEFVKFFNWRNIGESPPCGLLNCGNSCFANVALQCLTHTRPLVAYLMEGRHRRQCGRNDWCFLCDFQTHIERAMTSEYPFSPISIFSQLPNIGGNNSYGNQEDAHEFIRLAIDTMQSLCLDEFGGEKAIDPSSHETTIIQHIFGGRLQSQVICTNCNMISTRYENMMDLTVEIQGNSSSLEECLEQYTHKECLYGDNMYKCDGCNDYVKAWKRLCVRQAPNILSITLKRFQAGSFGKLNKRITFPEMFDLGPYMTRPANGTDIYKLYAVVVHVDLWNASSFGHYICYIKDFRGYWYRIDDSKVVEVDLKNVLSQGAYMLLYSRVNARPSSLEPIEALMKDEHQIVDTTEEVASVKKQLVHEGAIENSHDPISRGYNSHVPISHFDEKLCLGTPSEYARDDEMADAVLNSFYPRDNYFNSWRSDPFSAGASSSDLYDDYDDKLCNPFFAEASSSDYYDDIFCDPVSGEDLLDNWSRMSLMANRDDNLKSRTRSLNGVLISCSDEREQKIHEEDLQEPSCSEDIISEKFTWDDPTLKPVFSPGLIDKDLRRSRSRTRLLESGRLSLDDAANVNCNGSPKQKSDAEEIQSTTTLKIDDFSSSSDTPQLV